jgi:hypothetical protein
MVDGQIRVADSQIHQPGVYFGLPEAEYHGALALSAHGITRLRVSPLAWWTSSPLNPELVEEETDAKIIGKAYHSRIVEGREAFMARYAEKLDPAAYPSALRTVADLGELLRHCGVSPKATDRKADLIARVRAVSPGTPIWDLIEQEHHELNRGKILLDPALMERIELAAAMIETHPQLHLAFTGGMPEVSIFWTDTTTGVPCKARLDYLKPLAIVDLKTFDLRDIVPDRAIVRAVASYKYHVQASWYLRAADEIQNLVTSGLVYGDHDREWLRLVCDATAKTFLFVWQAKGQAPIVKGKVLPPGIVLDLGHVAGEEALVAWAQAWERWGRDPWLETYSIETFTDSEFPTWITD